jgi:hypothetical protein
MLRLKNYGRIQTSMFSFFQTQLFECCARHGPSVFKTYTCVKQYIVDTLIIPYFGELLQSPKTEYEWEILDAEIEHDGTRISLDENTIDDLNSQIGNVVKNYFENHPGYDWNDEMKLHITWIKDDSFIHSYASHELIQPKTTEE